MRTGSGIHHLTALVARVGRLSLQTPTLVPRKKALLGSRDLVVVVFIVFPGFFFLGVHQSQWLDY
jgi:hypothetical protein